MLQITDSVAAAFLSSALDRAFQAAAIVEREEPSVLFEIWPTVGWSDGNPTPDNLSEWTISALAMVDGEKDQGEVEHLASGWSVEGMARCLRTLASRAIEHYDHLPVPSLPVSEA